MANHDVMKSPNNGSNVVAIGCLPLLTCTETATAEDGPNLFEAVARRCVLLTD